MHRCACGRTQQRYRVGLTDHRGEDIVTGSRRAGVVAHDGHRACTAARTRDATSSTEPDASMRVQWS